MVDLTARFITVLLLFCYLISAFPSWQRVSRKAVPGKDFVYVSDLECLLGDVPVSFDDPNRPITRVLTATRTEEQFDCGVEYAKGPGFHPNQDIPAILVYEIGDFKYKYFSAVGQGQHVRCRLFSSQWKLTVNWSHRAGAAFGQRNHSG